MPNPAASISLPAFSQHQIKGGTAFTCSVTWSNIPNSNSGDPFVAPYLAVLIDRGSGYVPFDHWEPPTSTDKQGTVHHDFVGPNETVNARLQGGVFYRDNQGVFQQIEQLLDFQFYKE